MVGNVIEVAGSVCNHGRKSRKQWDYGKRFEGRALRELSNGSYTVILNTLIPRPGVTLKKNQ